MKKLLFIGVVASLLVACQPASKPSFDLANAKKEIEAANHELTELISKSDSVGMALAYSKDGALMPNNGPSVTGKDNITAFWGAFVRGGLDVDLKTSEVWGDENFITEEGLYNIKSKDGKVLDNGKYIVLWKKEDGKWKLHRDLSNTNLPLTK